MNGQQRIPDHFTVDQGTLDDITNYLVTQPYKDVIGLLNAMRQNVRPVFAKEPDKKAPLEPTKEVKELIDKEIKPADKESVAEDK